MKYHKKTGKKSRNHVKINIVMLIFVLSIEQDGIKIMTTFIQEIKKSFKKHLLVMKGARFTDKARALGYFLLK